jgi:hypothetical protein
MGYLSGQGKVYTARKGTDGLPLAFDFRGNVPAFELAISVDKLEHKESVSGNRLIDLILVTGKKVDLTMNMQEFTPENKALLLQGAVLSQGAGSVTNEILNGGLALEAGKTYALQGKNATSVVLTDSAGSPATMALTTNYTLNAPYGLIQAVGSQAGFTAPIKAAYTKVTGQKSVGLLTEAEAQLWLRFLGINTAQKQSNGAYKRFVLDLFNVQPDPTAGLGLIQDTLADFETKMSVLVDTTRASDAVGGQIGVLTWIDD